MSSGAVVFLTGLPSSGKSLLAENVRGRLLEIDVPCCVLDGDRVRECLVPAPGYDADGRAGFYETLARLAALLAGQGLVVLVAATANLRRYRDRAAELAPKYLEVWVNVGSDECRRRDTKGLYAAFARGQARDIPGEDAVYEPPLSAAIEASGGLDQRACDAIVTAIRGVPVAR